jgi:hypothetical protein
MLYYFTIKMNMRFAALYVNCTRRAVIWMPFRKYGEDERLTVEEMGQLMGGN